MDSWVLPPSSQPKTFHRSLSISPFESLFSKDYIPNNVQRSHGYTIIIEKSETKSFSQREKTENPRKPFFNCLYIKNYWIQSWQDYRICLDSSGFMGTLSLSLSLSLSHTHTHTHISQGASITAFSQLTTFSERSWWVLAVPSKSTNDDSIKIIVGEYNAPIAGKMVPQQREGESGFAKGSRVASLLVYIVKKFISHCQVQSI